MTTPETPTYHIRIRGHLGPEWSAWFEPMTITRRADGTTCIAGPLRDTAALYGLLARLRDLGATLLQVERRDPATPTSHEEWPAMSGPARRLPVSRAIAVQVVVVAVVAVVVLVLAVLHLADGGLGLGWAVGGLFGGLVVGLVASRSKRIVCDEGTDTVVSRTGWIGAVILGCFVVAQLVRGWILGHWVDGVGLTTLGLCVTAGTLIGQVVGTRRRVRAARPETGEGS